MEKLIYKNINLLHIHYNIDNNEINRLNQKIKSFYKFNDMSYSNDIHKDNDIKYNNICNNKVSGIEPIYSMYIIYLDLMYKMNFLKIDIKKYSQRFFLELKYKDNEYVYLR